MTQTNTDLAVRAASDAQDYMPVLGIEQAVERYNAVVEFAKKVLKPNRDYGTIPGTQKKNEDGTPSNASDTLLKPGAEKLCTLFGLSPRFEDYRITEDWKTGLFYYAYRCVMKNRSGRDVAESIGSANSFEKKYRTSSRKCPECGADAIKRSKYPPRDQPNAQPGWYCFGKADGCGANFEADDQAIIGQSEQIDVMAAADKVNTLQKMAQKRAFVGAVLLATNASEFFTQDVEDLDPVRTRDDAIDGEVVDSAKDDADFLEKWDSISDRHQLPRKIGRDAVMKTMFKRRKLGALSSVSFEIRKEMIGAFEKLTPDVIKNLIEKSRPKDNAGGQPDAPGSQSPASPQEPPITDQLVHDWAGFVAAAIESAFARGISDEVCMKSLEKLLGTRAVDQVGDSEKRRVITHIRAGTWDYEKATFVKKESKAA